MFSGERLSPSTTIRVPSTPTAPRLLFIEILNTPRIGHIFNCFTHLLIIGLTVLQLLLLRKLNPAYVYFLVKSEL